MSIDDFGAGFTSLAYLGSLAVSELKLDRSFLTRLATGAGPQSALVRATIALGHKLGMRVVAEGIEDHAALRPARQPGVRPRTGLLHQPSDAGQGTRFPGTPAHARSQHGQGSRGIVAEAVELASAQTGDGFDLDQVFGLHQGLNPDQRARRCVVTKISRRAAARAGSMSLRYPTTYQVTRATSEIAPPAASTAIRTFRNACFAWPTTSPGATRVPSPST